jgi:hypothetical protein
MRDEDGRYSTDDGGYYSNRNLSGRGESREHVRYGSQGNFNDRQGYGGRSDSEWDQNENSRRSSYRDWDHDEDPATSRRYEGMQSGRGQGQRYAPYRNSEEGYDSDSRWSRDQYGESDWNRPEGREGRNSSRWGQSDTEWGGRMSGRDQEMGYDRSGIDDDYGYSDSDRNNEGSRGERYTRYADVDDVEGQWDEDYRDRDSYNYSGRGRGTSSRSSSGHRR